MTKTLETLQFPNNWRLLFDVAGVESEFLDDMDSARGIVNLVSERYRN